jgi:hypothetical protein
VENHTPRIRISVQLCTVDALIERAETDVCIVSGEKLRYELCQSFKEARKLIVVAAVR